jgi:hypothetical protein
LSRLCPGLAVHHYRSAEALKRSDHKMPLLKLSRETLF